MMTMKIQELVLVLLLLCMKPGHIKSQSDDCSFGRSINLPLEVYQEHYQFNYPKSDAVKDLPSPPILNQGQCGVSKNDQSQQIVGGKDAPDNAWPWQVWLIFSHGMCGGVIINRDWIMTAGHCNGGDVAEVYVGNNSYLKGNRTRTKAAFEHDAVDLALFQLSSPLTFTDSVQPICLPEGNIWDASPCFVTGWGETGHFNYVLNSRLQQLRVRNLDQTLCLAHLSLFGLYDRDGIFFCFSSTGHSGISSGDSGGPVSCMKNGRYYLLGIITHNLPLDGGYVDYAVSVPRNMQWITDTILENS
ncbi:chymotrypsinogen A-like isoform X2 [Physella acuta]|nr:chymotrypsinogen A-like isoform X2 [Physella acuta]XP_059153227.1 chymotrypsinogen A-like isoform X2 [Physella acuta]